MTRDPLLGDTRAIGLRLVPRPEPSRSLALRSRRRAGAATACTPSGPTRTRAPSRRWPSCWRWSTCAASIGRSGGHVDQGRRLRHAVPPRPAQPDPERRPTGRIRPIRCSTRRHATGRRHDAAALPGRGSPRSLAPVRRAIGQRPRRLGHRPDADVPARSGEPSRGAVGRRGSAHHLRRGAGPLRGRLHRLRQGRARRGAGADRGLPHLRSLRARHAAGRQGRGAAAAAHRRQLRAAAPPDRRRRRAHLDVVLARPPQLGRASRWCSRPGGAAGGTPTRSACRRP